MRFFLTTDNQSDIGTTVVTVVPNITLPGNHTAHQSSESVFLNVLQVAAPPLAVLCMLIYILRLCYKAVRDDSGFVARNNHETPMIP